MGKLSYMDGMEQQLNCAHVHITSQLLLQATKSGFSSLKQPTSLEGSYTRLLSSSGRPSFSPDYRPIERDGWGTSSLFWYPKKTKR